jgi:hypothetical protein
VKRLGPTLVNALGIVLSERSLYRYAGLALVGMALLLLRRFTGWAWLGKAGAALVLPMVLWLVVMYGVIGPLLLVFLLGRWLRDKIWPDGERWDDPAP